MGCYVAHLTPGGGKSRRLAFATNSQATPEQGGHQAQAEPPQSHQQPPRTELEKQGARCKSLLSIYPNSLNSEIGLGGSYQMAQIVWKLKQSSIKPADNFGLHRSLLLSFARGGKKDLGWKMVKPCR